MTDLLTPNADEGNSESITIQTGDTTSTADAGGISIRGGDSTAAGGGSISVKPGSGTRAGRLAFFGSDGSAQRVMARPSGPAGDLWDVLYAYGLVTRP